MTTSLNKCVNVLTYGFVQKGDGAVGGNITPVHKKHNYFGKLPAISNAPDTVEQPNLNAGVGREPHPNDPVFYLEFTSSTDSAKNINHNVIASNLEDTDNNCTLKIFQKQYGKLVGDWDGWKPGWRTQSATTEGFAEDFVNGRIHKLLDAIVSELIHPSGVTTVDDADSSMVDTCQSRRIKNIYLRVNLI